MENMYIKTLRSKWLLRTSCRMPSSSHCLTRNSNRWPTTCTWIGAALQCAATTSHTAAAPSHVPCRWAQVARWVVLPQWCIWWTPQQQCKERRLPIRPLLCRVLASDRRPAITAGFLHLRSAIAECYDNLKAVKIKCDIRRWPIYLTLTVNGVYSLRSSAIIGIQPAFLVVVIGYRGPYGYRVWFHFRLTAFPDATVLPRFVSWHP